MKHKINKYNSFLIIYLFFNLSNVNSQNKNLQLSETEKIFGLSKFWAEVSKNFVYYDKLKFNWDSLYISYIVKVQKCTITYQYYDTLQSLCAKLKDGHTNVYKPDSYYELIYRPQFRTRLIENKVIVTTITNDSVLNTGIKIGTEILKINNIDVHQYANKKVRPYVSSSTTQDEVNRTYNYELLFTPKNTALTLTIKNVQEESKTVLVKEMLQTKNKEKLTLTMLKDSIGLLTVNSFAIKEFYNKFDSVYKYIYRCKALIIDVRNNGGGSDSQGEYILEHLFSTNFYSTKTRSREYNSFFNGANHRPISYYEVSSYLRTPSEDKPIFTKPVIVLICERTFSAAENFAMGFDYMKRGKMIGRPTGGSTGMPMTIDLPGGGSARICTKEDLYPDGKKFVGIGVIPDVHVKETHEAILKGVDLDIEKALELLKK